ncbi:MAG: bifunctional folylpolyglutamate synthase/dihydrofolate synthase [Alphaproteobacteria bacterium]|nr:MAG: hypothetical protein CNC74_03700 [alpha proteobacterium MED-G09]|tara:strand:- start:8861 stop:10147 length:1287 start_codon:yes stop_codon:yes gene_type:complete
MDLKIFKDKFFYDNFLINPDKNLSRVKSILSKLGNPEATLSNVIHIAGTNGKGSTLAFLKSCLIENNYSVNAFVSPHLKTLNERIIIKGSIIDDDSLDQVIRECLSILGKKKISFFEFMTACAFELFKRNTSDWSLIEVGMGGSHDATNSIPNKDLSIITPISLDHEIFLGETIKKIATEKLGIINHKSTVVFGPQEESLEDLIKDTLSQKNSTGFFYGKDWTIKKINRIIKYEDGDNKIEFQSIGLKGDHQIINAGMCIASLKILQRKEKIELNDNQIKDGIAKTFWPGRLTELSRGLKIINNVSCDIWVDGCHNPAGSNVIAEEIIRMNEKNKKETVLILGMSKDKKIDKFLDNFKGIVREILVVPIKNRESINFDQVTNASKGMGFNILEKQSISEALESIARRDNLRILICGSLYLAAEALLMD